MPDHIAQGTVLADRFRLITPVSSDLPHTGSWTAHDQASARDVRVLLLRGPHVGRALDGARKAALVDEPRLNSVVAVNDTEPHPFIVTESYDGDSLAELLIAGPIQPELARSVAGEVAQALGDVGKRGIHHLGLRPSCIIQNSDGNILVTGVGIDGILFGEQISEGVEAARKDAVDLVAVLYSMLTATWPGHPDRAGSLTSAPQSSDGPTPVVDAVGEVPNDLDTLCAVTLGPHMDGPHSLAELSDELAPWGELVSPHTKNSSGIFAIRAERMIIDKSLTSSDEADVPANNDVGSAWAPVAGGNITGGQRRINIHSGPKGSDSTMSHSEDPAQASSCVSGEDESEQEATQASGPGWLDTSEQKQAPHPQATQRQSATELNGTTDGQDSVQPPLGGARETTPVRRSAMDGFVPGAGAARAVAEASSRRTPPPAAPARPVRSTTPRTYALGGSPTGQMFPPQAEPLQPTLPQSNQELSGPTPIVKGATRRSFDPTKVVMTVGVAIILVIGLIAANSILNWNFSFFGLGQNNTNTATQSPSNDAAHSEPAVAEPAILTSVVALDPYGDNNEHPETANRIIDGDPATAWSTRFYKQSDFGGKAGVGVKITFEKSVKVRTVKLTADGTGGKIQVMADVPDSSGAGTVHGTGTFVSPTTEITLDDAPELSSVVLWFPELPKAPDGTNRINLAEVTVN